MFVDDGSRRGGSGQGPVQLLDLSGRAAGPCDHPMRTQLLLGLHQELLGPGRLPGGLRLPTMSAELQPEACARQKHHAGRRGGEIQEDWTPRGRDAFEAKLCRGRGRGVRRLHREEEQGCEILPGVSGLLLRGARPASLRVRRLQETQAGVGLQKVPGDDLRPTRQAAGGVLPHRQAVYLLPVSD